MIRSHSLAPQLQLRRGALQVLNQMRTAVRPGLVMQLLFQETDRRMLVL